MEVIEFYGIKPAEEAVPVAGKPLEQVKFGSNPESLDRTMQYLLKQPFPQEPPMARSVEDAEVCEEVVVTSLVDGRPVKLRMAVYDENIAASLPPQ